MAVRVISCFVFCSVLTLCGSLLLTCNVTQNDDQTTYTILGMPRHVPGDCQYSWSNESDHVLANTKVEKCDPVVKTRSLNTLVTSKCLSIVRFEHIGSSQEEDHTATCTVNCHENLQNKDVKEGSPQWIVAVVVVLVVLVVIALTGILVPCFRNKASRICGCFRCSSMYTGVNLQNVATNVEAAN